MLKMTLLALFSTSVAAVWPWACIYGFGPDGTEACDTYVECQAHHDVTTGADPTDTSAYDSDGSCWSSNQEAADACAAACESAVESLAADLDANGEPLGPCERP